MSRRPRRGRGLLAVAIAVAAAALAPALAGVGRTRAAPTGAAAPTLEAAVPVRLAAGACSVFAPTTASNGKTVFLDAGHGGLDTGAIATIDGRGLVEKELTLALAQRVLPELRRRGFRVVLSRVADTGVAPASPADAARQLLSARAVKGDIVARNLCANASNAAALVSIHLNSFGDPAVAGSQTLYNANRPFSARSHRLARLLQREVHAALERRGSASPDRGVSTDAGAGGDALTAEAAAYGQLLMLGPAAPPWFTTPTRMPGAVIEPLFLTNPTEARIARSAAGRAALAAAVARAVTRFAAAA